MSADLHFDVVIFGGGIAGLWTLHAVQSAGYSALLLESGSLGGGQTIAAQGVLHAGLKYALQGVLTDSSEALADMPARWMNCLEGKGEIDLSQARVTTDHQYLWSCETRGANMKLKALSMVAESRMRGVARDRFPPVFRDHYQGPLYRLEETVLDMPSLLAALAEPLTGQMARVDWERDRLIPDPQGGIASLVIEGTRVTANRYVFAAGAGNEALMKQSGGEAWPAMQRRPLLQVIVRKAGLPKFCTVCLGPGSKPALVSTSHCAANGDTIWYLGGSLAECDAEVIEEEHQLMARDALRRWMPWIDLAGAAWSSLWIERAEFKQARADRPTSIYCEPHYNAIVVWPTKMVLAPRAADRVLAQLDPPAASPVTGDFARPAIAKPVWDA